MGFGNKKYYETRDGRYGVLERVSGNDLYVRVYKPRKASAGQGRGEARWYRDNKVMLSNAEKQSKADLSGWDLVRPLQGPVVLGR